jgi:TonB-linked SusC/RagA family outer membrane protein
MKHCVQNTSKHWLWWAGFLAVLMSFTADAQSTAYIKGKVLDEKGSPLIGATVRVTRPVEFNLRGTNTDEKGMFVIDYLPAGSSYDITVSYIGYEKQLIQDFLIHANDNNSLLVRLTPEAHSLNDIVVIGYGTQSKASVTSSVSTIKIGEVDQGSGFNPVKMLQGRAAGVNIISPSGRPGEAPVVMIRGIGSISGGSSPLYVVDGIPNETFPGINPNDIESMEVLKDASAAAIYGSRANSGVIIITTKSGKSGKNTINASYKTGWGKVYQDIRMANSEQYSRVMQAAIDNYNSQKGTSLVYYKPAEIEETNWVKEISRKSARNQSFDVNLAGGNDKTQFFTSFGYFQQEGILRTSEFQQYNFRLKVGHEVNPYMKLSINLSGSAAPTQLLEETSTSLKVLRTAREEQPWYSPYMPDGSYKPNGSMIIRHNPVMLINEENWKSTRYEGLTNVSLKITPLKGFSYTPSISAYGWLVNEKKKLTEKMVARATSAGWGAVAQDRNLGTRYVIDNIFSYENTSGGLYYNLMAGHSYEKYGYDRFGAYSDNYANGAYPSSSFDLVNAGSNIYPSSGIGYDAYNIESYIGRLNLTYKDRYLANVSVRRDGSSRFSKDKRYGTFPAGSFGWIISKEPFWNISQNVVSFLKARTSFGITGSMAGIGNYAPLSLVSSGSSYNGQGGFVVSQDAQSITWEKAKQIDIGVDAEFLNSRISFTMDYFKQTTTDLLYDKPIYSTSGYTSVASNIGSLQNQGLEFSANAKLLTGQLKWTLGGNISFIKNKLLSLYDNTDMYIVPSSGSNLLGGQIHALINGKSIGSFYMHEQLGIYQYDSEVPEKLVAKGVRAGDLIYRDVNGDGDITEADRLYVGKATPDFYGGITSNFSYKGFELNLFGQFSKGSKVMASWRGANGTEGTDHLGNALANVKLQDGTTVTQFFGISEHAATTYWHGPGTSNTTPRPIRQGVFSGYTYGYNNITSTRFLEDASYFKLKTLTLAYNLPSSVTEKLHFKGSRVFCTVDNVFSINKYSGYDPEQSFSSKPGDGSYGVDFGLQSSLRTVMFGVNLQF